MATSIAHALWLKTPATRAIIAALDAARPRRIAFRRRVRAQCVARAPVDDIDIATQLTPDAVMAAANKAGLSPHPTGIDHGTITVEPACAVRGDHVAPRRDHRWPPRDGRVHRRWAEDAQRRDFRLNALYADAEGNLFDPTGGGIDDAKAGRIIFVGDAETRIREDYLRILRFFRFSAWYGKGAPDAVALAACEKLRDGLTTLSVERVWKKSRSCSLRLIRAQRSRRWRKRVWTASLCRR